MTRNQTVAAVLRTDSQNSSGIVVPFSRKFKSGALTWSRVVRNRVRWNSFENEENSHAEELRKELKEYMSIDSDGLMEISSAEIISVDIPKPFSVAGREAIRFPWEYALSAVTKNIRNGKRLTVVRSFSGKKNESKSVSKILYVESRPAQFVNLVDFKTERVLISEHLGSNKFETTDFEALINPTKEVLSKKVQEFSPDLVHIAGVSTTGARTLLNIESPLPNGLCVASEASELEIIEYEELCKILNSSPDSKPTLVFANLYQNGSVFSTNCLKHGCSSVLSINNSIDPSIVVRFLDVFYHSWKETNFSKLLNSFDNAYRSLEQESGALRGTAIVLTSALSLYDNADWPSNVVPYSDQQRSAEGQEREDITTTMQAKQGIETSIKPLSKLNYAILQNENGSRGQLFESFMLVNKTNCHLWGLHVNVELKIGSECFSYRQAFNIQPTRARSFEHQIRVPLTTTLIREITESVKSSIYVCITYNEISVYEHTYDVTLLPANEWHDNVKEGGWLPTFVLPRDPTIEKFIDGASRYLKSIVDCPDACFVGYHFDSSMRDDYKTDKTFVDYQVQAIWSSLLYDNSFNYMTPPPTYTESSQRLRTPTQIVRSNSGTCIDLTLLFAACLEYVDIKPAILLYRGHALVAYWRDNSDYSRFSQALSVQSPAASRKKMDDKSIDTDEFHPDMVSSDAAWVVTDQSEVYSLVVRGALIPIETTELTRKRSYRNAKDTAVAYVEQNHKYMKAMVDIQLARRSDVTPLPLLDTSLL